MGCVTPAFGRRGGRGFGGWLPEPPADVLDADCGTGTLSVLLAEHGYCVTAVDVSSEMVQRARAKAAERGVAIEFVHGDAADLDAAPGSIDVVLVRHLVRRECRVRCVRQLRRN